MVELSPLDSAAVFESATGRLRLENVMVPNLGIFEAELDMLVGTPVLSFELNSAAFKDLEPSSTQAEQQAEQQVQPANVIPTSGATFGY